MNEREFLKKLEDRAQEQEKLMKGMVLSKVFKSVSFWLGEHPYRILIPIAFIITLALRVIIGMAYDEFILKIFGKL